MHKVWKEGAGSKEAPHGGGGQLFYGKRNRVARTNAVSWCLRCGAHAESRIGTAMAKDCTPIMEGEKSRRAYRCSLLLRGLHPISKNKLG